MARRSVSTCEYRKAEWTLTTSFQAPIENIAEASLLALEAFEPGITDIEVSIQIRGR
jgi:hypothetical protein